jgi:hypothetical protein
VWIVTSVRRELPDHVIEGVWSTYDAALEGLLECERSARTVRCYVSHAVVDAPEAY